MFEIAEISAAPHFPRPLRPSRPAIERHALSELLSALCAHQNIGLREVNGELLLVSASYPGEQ